MSTTGAGPGRDAHVGVVGAGPVGMVTALALRSLGLPVIVWEADPADRVRPGSRAIFLHRESMELLEQVSPGLGWTLARAGLVWSTKQTLWRGRVVFEKSYPAPRPERLPPLTSLPQVRMEAFLADACLRAGVEFRYASPISGVTSSDDEVVVRGNQFESRVSFLVGADGARSIVRSEIGAQLHGTRSDNWFVIVDVTENDAEPMPAARIFHYEHPGVGGRNVLLVPFAGGWRVDLQCGPDDDPNEYGSESGARRWVASVLPDRYVDHISWISTYRFMQVVADHFVDVNKRVLLVGEAAHLFAPFGARGLNSGIVDAVAAAKAIHGSLAGDGDMSSASIVEYETSRRTAAEYNREAAASALEHLTGREWHRRIRRSVAATAAARWPAAGQWLDSAPYGPRAGSRRHATSTY